MSYALAAPLQAAIFARLQSDPTLQALIGTAIFDAAPSGVVPPTYVALGPEEVVDRSDQGIAGAEHRFTLSVVTEAAGFSGAKEIAAAVGTALQNPTLTLSRGRVVGLWFDRASARRDGTGGTLRRIDLRFRARVEDI